MSDLDPDDRKPVTASAVMVTPAYLRMLRKRIVDEVVVILADPMDPDLIMKVSVAVGKLKLIDELLAMEPE